MANAIDELAITELVDRAQSELGAIDIIVPNKPSNFCIKGLYSYGPNR